ncbi:MAG TPA: tRNA lysidine(34) synthetase TilS, partial [bacterium]|nr:tRNA lysidine(34) synthetase TilS [bacterium]
FESLPRYHFFPGISFEAPMKHPAPSPLVPTPPFPKRARLLLALSGGGDSTALLSLLADLRPPGTLFAAHVNYGLRGGASRADEAFVRALCRRFGVPLTVLRLKDARARARREGKSLQDWAREKRYAFFARLCVKRGAWGVAAAHQADDQAETILDRILRGAGTRGLTGLRPVQALRFGARGTGVRVWRPLLAHAREDLRRHLRSRGIRWREDAGNRKPDYRRNRIRHQLLPLLARWNPSIARALVRMGEVASAQEDFLAQCLGPLRGRLGSRWGASSYRGRQRQWAREPLALKRLWVRTAAERLCPAARGLSFERVEEAREVWDGTRRGPRDLGQGLSVEARGGVIWMRSNRLSPRGGRVK